MRHYLCFGLVLASIATAQALTPIVKLPGAENHSVAQKKAEWSTAKKGFVLYENFSGWDGKTKHWIPEGWTVEHNGTCTRDYSWVPLQPTEYLYPATADGDYCFYINYSEEASQDEWLISPTVTPAENMLIAYHMQMNPALFYSTKNLSYTPGVGFNYDGDKIVVFNLQVYIQEDGGEWVLLRDYAEEYKKYSYRELTRATKTANLVKQTIDIADYANKNVRIAFRYSGIEGDTMILDAISVGYPTLDNVKYMEPTNALYYGFSRNGWFLTMGTDIALLPANTQIKWTNNSEDEATFTWLYPDQDSKSTLTSYDQEVLGVSYAADPAGLTPSLYETPVLTAEAPERIDATYKSPVPYFQIGGKPSFTDGSEEIAFTLFPFPMNYLDVAYTDVRDSYQGAYSVPVFGHNEFTNNYWLRYWLKGEEAKEGDYSHLIGIANLFYPSDEVPLTVSGMSIYGWGRIWDEAELTATIYALNSDKSFDYDTYTVVARAKITGKDVVALEDKDSKDYLYLPFKFDAPVNVMATEEHPAFLFMFEGFNTDKVDYFTPIQSKLPNDIGMPAGYLLHETNLSGNAENGTFRSLTGMQYIDNNQYVTDEGSFAIGIDGEYPLDVNAVEAVSPVASEIVGIYDLNGVKVSSTQAGGIYIVKYSDGSVKKIVK